MQDNAHDIACPNCKQPLQTVVVAPSRYACVRCGKRVLMNDSYREALTIATVNDAWIEKIYWKEASNDFLSLFMFFFIDFPLVTLKFVGWFAVLCSIGLVNGHVFGNAPIGWATWSLIPAGFVAAFVVLWLLKRGIQKTFANQFVTVVHFVVSSCGIIVVSPFAKPLFLPWSSIVNYSWTSHVESLTSQMTLSYRTADNQVATVVLDGEEKVQPLGELVDILNARLER